MKSIVTKLNQLKKEVEANSKELEILPEGYLVRKGNAYGHRIKAKETSITKQPEMIKLLCRKKYLLSRQEQLKYNLNLTARDYEKFNLLMNKELIAEFPRAYQDLPAEYFYHLSVEKWLTKPFFKNPYPIEGGGYPSKKGNLFRSKSEVLIANMLEEYGLIYQHDVRFMLGNKSIYPDFIIKNPYNGKTVIWEHFGALHKSNYEQKMNEKMAHYISCGYKPFEDLIYTFEFEFKTFEYLKNLIEDLIL